jgi:hypothetical protein
VKQPPYLLLRLITKANNVTPIVKKHAALKRKRATSLVTKPVVRKMEKEKNHVKLLVKNLVALKKKKKRSYCQRKVSNIFCTSFLMYPMAGAKES